MLGDFLQCYKADVGSTVDMDWAVIVQLVLHLLGCRVYHPLYGIHLAFRVVSKERGGYAILL